MTTATGEHLYELVIRNLDILKKITNKSEESNKEYKAQAYQRAIDNIKDNLSQGKKDPCKAVAGKSVQERINWIIQHRRDIYEVSEYIEEDEESEQEEFEEEESEEEEFEEEEFEEEESEDEESNQFVVKEELSKRRMQKICNTMKSLNTIESIVFNLNLKNELVSNILRDLNKLKADCREELFV
jgi:alpha-galactosidase/6-phospho-beta-glucosidase family protein